MQMQLLEDSTFFMVFFQLFNCYLKKNYELCKYTIKSGSIMAARFFYRIMTRITAKELAKMVNGVVVGNPDATVGNFAKIEEARDGDLSFIANSKYTHMIYDTHASVVLVRNDFEPERPIHTTMLKVADPYATLAELMRTMVRNLQPAKHGIEQPCHIAEGVEVPEDAYIGAFAYVGKGVRLGKGVQIYPQAYVGDDVTVGEGTTIYSGAKVYPGCIIGRRCVLHSGSVVGADGFGFAPVGDHYEKIPQIGCVELADDVEVGANTTIDRATMGATVIGQGTKIDNLVQIAHNVTVGKNNVFAAQGGVAGSAHIGDNNMFGGQVGIAGHIRIGSSNQIGAQSGIPNSIGNGNRLMGYPAIDARQWAKNLVYIKKLPQLFNK